VRKVDTFILRSYLGPFILTFFIAIFILLMQFVWKYVDELVGRGLEFLLLAKLLGLVALTMISLALPLAILLSSLMAFGNLGEYMELTALKASGISLQRAMRPVFLLCSALAVFAFYFSNNLLPIANLKMKTLLNDISNKRPELNIKPGIFNSDIQNFVIRIGKKSPDGKYLTNLMIYDHSRHRGNDRLIIAERGEMQQSADKRYLELRLFKGSSYTEVQGNSRNRGTQPFLREEFREDLIRFDLSIFAMNKTDENLYKRNYQMLNLQQLEAETDTLERSLEKDKSYLPRILFHGPFFEAGKPYSTTAVTPPKRSTLRGDTLKATDATQTASNDSAADRLRKKLEVTQLLKTGKLPQRDSLARPEPAQTVQTAEFKPNPLRDTKEVMGNFDKADQIRIYEQAAHSVRSGKATLDFSVETFDQEQERIYRHQIEWHRKFTLSFACLLLFLIGAPLGAIVRKGGLGMPVVFSLIFFVSYHMLSITGEKLAREGVLTPFWGMWFSSAILLPIGLFLTYKATRDSALFDKESYVRLWKRLFPRKSNARPLS
jgi:lipopolysaccharide export system permease protein